MKKTLRDSTKLHRRAFCSLLTFAAFNYGVLGLSGCSAFKSQKKKDSSRDEEFEIDEDEDQDDERSVFDSERKKEKEMSDFLAENGRKSGSKRGKVRPGDDFLLSSKAKEIYANTER